MRVALLGSRVAANLVDMLITGVAWSAIWVVTGDRASGWVWLAVVALYTVVPIALWGQTPGKRALGVRVVRDYQPSVQAPGWRASAIRYAVLLVPGLAPGAYGSLLGPAVTLLALYGIATDALARGIHDTLAGTRVIDVRPGSRLKDRYQENVRSARSAPRPRRKRRRAGWQP